ncbi:MAG: ISAzo13 family transposase, partial [Syntrophobacteraceae bacterium]
MADFTMLQRKYELLRPRLDEASMRLCAAADAMIVGRGGPSLVAKASGLSRTTIYAGLSDLDQSTATPVAHPKTAG